jgi:hypothetical protein
VLTISGEVDTKALDKNPKFGLAIALKPWSFPIFLKPVIGTLNSIQYFFWWPLKGGQNNKFHIHRWTFLGSFWRDESFQ